MIKVTLGESNTQEAKPKPFPKFMIVSKSQSEPRVNGIIVFFTEPKKGICIVSNLEPSFVGEYYNHWNMEIFTDYNEPITIQNA